MLYGQPLLFGSSGGLKYSGNNINNIGIYTTVKGNANLINLFKNHNNITGVSFYECYSSGSAFSCFQNCNSLIEITNFPSTITNTNSLCYNCPSLQSFQITNSVSVTWDNSFRDCSNIKKINISANTTGSNFNYTFYNCDNLQEVYLPNNISNLSYTFYNCSNLKTINTIHTYNNINTSSGYMRMFDNNIGNVKIDNLYDQALMTATNSNAIYKITSVNNYINTNGYRAFYNSIINNVNCVRNVSNGSQMFYKSENLNFVNLNDSLKSLSDASDMFNGITRIPCENIYGFGISNRNIYFTNLYNISGIFYGTEVNRRIASNYSGNINASKAVSKAGAPVIIFDFPNATFVNFTNACNHANVQDLYINVPIGTTFNLKCFCNSNNTQSVDRRVYIPAQGNLNIELYNQGTCPAGYFYNTSIEWTLGSNGDYYNTARKIHVYPVNNVLNEIENKFK